MRIAHLVLKRILVLAVKARHVRARTTHIKADYAIVTGAASGQSRSDNAPSWAAEQTVFRAKVCCGQEPSRARHHVQRPAA